MSQRMQLAVLRAASLLAPREQRAEWMEEWRSELWYIRRCETTRFCLGAFRDALWLRRNNESPEQTRILQSPVRCLVFLAALAAFSLVFAVWLLAPTDYPHLGIRDWPLTALEISCLTLPYAVATGWVQCRLVPNSWRGRLCRMAFLALKIALIQPMIFCGFIVVLNLGRNPLAMSGLIAASLLALRWTLADQQRRCPVCLRLLTNPVRIGTSSHTFLEWHGTESMCSLGHGLLHAREDSATDSWYMHWLALDDSWKSLFRRERHAD